MDEKFLKPYNPLEAEKPIYERWEESGYFNPDNLPGERSRAFTIVMPPPNANGNLHAGHALFITLEDLFIRFRRMQGYKALWIPGADHAGFETQVVYEKKLEKEGRSRFQMDPKELYEEILAFTLENKKNMEGQVRALGASCDWSREKFTLDPDVVTRVQETFVKMHGDGLVYRGNRIVNWCSKHQTSLSDIETESVDEPSKLYYFQYGPFEIATARPETKFADKYVVMHPDDARYASYEHGQKLTVEWINGPIEATVLKDEVIDPEFGTGVMTITPWHSQVDFDLAKKYDLPMEQILDWRGKLLPIAGEFEGMKIAEAREKIVEKLRAKGLVTRIDESYRHVVKRCYKCATLIEPQVKDQWFVKMAPLAEKALAAEAAGDFRFVPDNEAKIFRHWMENVLDWNISRQIVWGIQIPAWFRGRGTAAEEVVASLEQPEGEGWERDADTFDTWFSSGQWPLMVTGYPDGPDYGAHFPTDVMETGRDIIFFWVARMVAFSLYLTGKAPFHTIYLHGLVNDANGKKMSKSKGNVINPLELTDKYGTDALRMSLVVGNTPGTDLALREDKVKGYKHFANKLWNIARFVLENTEGADLTAPLTDADQELRAELDALAKDVTADLEAYRIYLAAEKLYHYVWDRFAAVILEESKPLLQGDDIAAKASRQALLLSLLTDSLKLLHPFMPFVTEEVWGSVPGTDGLLMVAPWPSAPTA
ncbi:MAG TPA: valine--tRNA ligase [Candidatus Paceibacterota bacterium]|jgi:valyl-tRNA synthetase